MCAEYDTVPYVYILMYSYTGADQLLDSQCIPGREKSELRKLPQRAFFRDATLALSYIVTREERMQNAACFEFSQTRYYLSSLCCYIPIYILYLFVLHVTLMF